MHNHLFLEQRDPESVFSLSLIGHYIWTIVICVCVFWDLYMLHLIKVAGRSPWALDLDPFSFVFDNIKGSIRQKKKKKTAWKNILIIPHWLNSWSEIKSNKSWEKGQKNLSWTNELLESSLLLPLTHIHKWRWWRRIRNSCKGPCQTFLCVFLLNSDCQITLFVFFFLSNLSNTTASGTCWTFSCRLLVTLMIH